MWLYQLNQEEHPPSAFRREIWETQRWHWNYGQKRPFDHPIEVGDTVVFFYGTSKGFEPGIYAWAVIDRYDADSKTLHFIPTAPSNHLKMDPWWDEEAEKLVNLIRGPMMAATLFLVPDAMIPRVRLGIKKWLAAVG
jgi:hypothetical protein